MGHFHNVFILYMHQSGRFMDHVLKVEETRRVRNLRLERMRI